MKLKPKEGCNEVDFHGIPVVKPVDCPFVAADEDGRVYPYYEEPTTCNGKWRGDYEYRIAVVDLGDNDWRETLVEYDADGNVVKPKRRFMVRGKVVEQPASECEWVIIYADGDTAWCESFADAVDGSHVFDIRSAIHIDDLQEVL